MPPSIGEPISKTRLILAETMAKHAEYVASRIPKPSIAASCPSLQPCESNYSNNSEVSSTNESINSLSHNCNERNSKVSDTYLENNNFAHSASTTGKGLLVTPNNNKFADKPSTWERRPLKTLSHNSENNNVADNQAISKKGRSRSSIPSSSTGNVHRKRTQVSASDPEYPLALQTKKSEFDMDMVTSKLDRMEALLMKKQQQSEYADEIKALHLITYGSSAELIEVNNELNESIQLKQLKTADDANRLLILEMETKLKYAHECLNESQERFVGLQKKFADIETEKNELITDRDEITLQLHDIGSKLADIEVGFESRILNSTKKTNELNVKHLTELAAIQRLYDDLHAGSVSPKEQDVGSGGYLRELKEENLYLKTKRVELEARVVELENNSVSSLREIETFHNLITRLKLVQA